MIVKRIGPLSFAKIGATLYAIMGLIAGCILSLISLAGGFANETSPIPGFGAIFGVGAVVLLPLLYGCLGFVFTLFVASIYNVVARLVGGIELDVQ
jgi:hypothetical protein